MPTSKSESTSPVWDTDPDDPGEILLDFDPSGQPVEVRMGSTVILQRVFPNG